MHADNYGIIQFNVEYETVCVCTIHKCQAEGVEISFVSSGAKRGGGREDRGKAEGIYG